MGGSVYVHVEGVDKYLARLDKAKRTTDALDEPMKEAGEMALRGVKSYPPYGSWPSGQISSAPFRPGSSYRRTFKLQDAWQGRLGRAGGNIVRYYITLAPGSVARKYAPYVVGDKQAAVHFPWWIPISQWPKVLQPFVQNVFRKWSKKIV